jgi:hypothetical protein
MKGTITRTGIGAFAPVEFDVSQAKQLFSMVIDERGSNADLQQLVTHHSLFELIVYVVDFHKGLRASINQKKSKIAANSAKARARNLLHGWLEININRYTGKLDDCAQDALSIPGFGRGYSWTRREITEYRKGH